MIRPEQVTTKAVLLDVDTGVAIDEVSRRMVEKLHAAAIKDSGLDTEFWLHHKTTHISRLYPNSDLNKEWVDIAAQEAVQEELLPQGLFLKAKASGRTILFEPTWEEDSLADGQVDIQTLASELHSQDSPSPAVGIIINAGDRTSHACLKDRLAIACAHGGFQTVLRTSEYIPVDADLTRAISPESLVSFLAPLSRLTKFLVGSHQPDRNSRFLALPGSKPMMHAMIKLAGVQGWKLNIVV